MRDGFKVIDADRHVLEPSDLFDRYLPARFRGRVRIEGPNQSYRYVDGELISDSNRLPRRVTGQAAEDFGFTFNPAALHWQGLDPLEFLRRFPDRIYHVHLQDVAINLNGRTSLLSPLPPGDARRGWDHRAGRFRRRD